MKGRHALALRIERQLADSRKPALQVGPGVVLARGMLHQRHLGRVAQPIARRVLRHVVVQGHGRQQGRSVVQHRQGKSWGGVHVLHRHLVEREGARLVGADVGNRAQRFHSRQLANERLVLYQPLGAQSQRDGDQRGQGFGQGGNGQRDGHQQQVAQRLAPQPAHPKKQRPN